MLNRTSLFVICALLLAACEGELDSGTQDSAPSDLGAAADAPPGIDKGKAKQDKGKPAPDKGKPKLDKGKPKPKDTGGGKLSGKPGEFVRSAAGRSYRLLVPGGYSPAKPIPLVIAFHGSGDSGGNFYAICKYVGFSSAAAPANFALLVPDTRSPYKDFALWSGNPNQDVGKMKQEMSEVLSIVKGLTSEYNIDLKRVHALGFSNGGLFTAVAGMHHAKSFASLTVAGYGWGGFYPLVTPTRKIPLQLLCGTGDSFHAKAQQSANYLKAQGHPSRFLSASGVGHKFSGLSQKHPPASLFQWMAKYAAP